MNARRPSAPKGLILLVVLGMLALFSMLSITYVVFASHSRVSSVALARSEHRGTPPQRLIDEALQQLLRGTTDSQSALWKHSLLEDLYGSSTTDSGEGSLRLRVRIQEYPANAPPTRITPNSLQRPMILGGRFLRIPIEVFPELATEHDVYTGRIVTFLGGPLVNQSFRVVRYIGSVPSNAPFFQVAQQYSIAIDLSEANASMMSTFGSVTLSIEDWIKRLPNGSIPGSLQRTSGSSLCHATVNGAVLNDGFSLLLNDTALNGHGTGIAYDGIPQTHQLTFDAANQTPPPMELAEIDAALQPNYGSLGSNFVLHGDADESYDAPDFNDFFLAHRSPGGLTSEAVLPSFHRAALVNYLASWKEPENYTPADLLYTLDRIVHASGRPLSINVTNIRSNTPRWPARSGDRTSYVLNPNFYGTNFGSTNSGLHSTPQLHLDLQNNWASVWPTVVSQYTSWLRWLTAGPWDVDNDGDGLSESVWVDLNLPLMTSSEGKLLRMLASYQVEDLDERLDVNAVGSLAQASGSYTQPTPVTDSPFALGVNVYLPQGLGFGCADSSLRPLFPSNPTYQKFLEERYSSADSGDAAPGSTADDTASQLSNRERRPRFVHGALPALPISVWGREALGLDRLGNPLLLTNDLIFDSDTNGYDQTTNDPYEARLRRGAFGDRPFSIADWERIYRIADWDRSSLPNRLEQLLNISARRAITPRSAHLRSPVFSGRSLNPDSPIDSFFKFVDVILKRRDTSGQVSPNGPPILPFDSYRQFFPLEFHRGERFNLNRPFGNGYDDDLDGQIDEPEELANVPQEAFAPETGTANGNSGDVVPSGVIEDYLLGQTNLDPLNPTGIFSGCESRQLFARHLYCLAQLVIPPNYKFPNIAVIPTVEERSRILAQWAVNVVDFRDADAAMTRFPYDADPLADKDLSANVRYGWEPTDGVVWGMEQPELLLTESLATHDLRTKKVSPNRDELTQYRLPQGSLFLELMCPRTTAGPTNSNLPGVPTSLYSDRIGPMALDLGRLSPADGNNERFPVWRIYIGESRPKGSTDTTFTRYNDTGNKHSLTYQFPSSSQSGLLFDWRPIEKAREPSSDQGRIIVFTPGFIPSDLNTPNVASPARDHVFVNRSGDALLRGGQYLVIGPREFTYFGSRRSTQRPPVHQPNTHRIQLTNTWARIYQRDPILSGLLHVAQRPSMADCVTMIASASAPLEWPLPNDPLLPSADRWIGLNVSEPLPGSKYYPMPTVSLNSADNSIDPATDAKGFKNLPYDAYHDYSGSSSPAVLEPFDRLSRSIGQPLENWANRDDDGEMPLPGSQPDWCTAYLQRLADPEKPYHVAFNPYITVDWIPIDLTLFSGEDDVPAGTKYQLASRQKTGFLIDSGTLGYQTLPFTNRNRTFYSYQTLDLPLLKNYRTGLDYLGTELLVDQEFGGSPPAYSVNRLNPAESAVTLGFLNYSIELSGEPLGLSPTYTGFLGAPKNVPASLFWANRPFINSFELGFVPLSSPGQFLQEFSASATTNPYSDASDRSNGFSHLMNWFSDQLADSTAEPISLSALLELVETPSPWSDADSHVTPSTVAVQLQTTDELQAATNEVMVTYRAPYNRVPSFVEPGRMNLNTVADVNAFRGLMWNSIVPATLPHNPITLATARNTGNVPYFAELMDSRRGYLLPTPSGVIPNGNSNLHPDYPTEFAGVFKSSFEAGMVPGTRDDTLDKLAKSNAAQATLIRSKLLANSPPLFNATSTGLQPHAFTEFYPLTRLANLVTTRSNVFAVRITIGYFEYDPLTGLGLEYGAEQGRARRHRAFYVIDRSVPVGFQVGQDLNTGNAILVRRIIE